MKGEASPAGGGSLGEVAHPQTRAIDDGAPRREALAPRLGRPPLVRKGGDLPISKFRSARGSKATWFSSLIQAGVIGEFVRLSSEGTIVFLDPTSPDFYQRLVDAGLARDVNPLKDPIANLKLKLRRHGYVVGRTVDRAGKRPLVFIPEIVLVDNPWDDENLAGTVGYVSGYYKARNKVLNRSWMIRNALNQQKRFQQHLLHQQELLHQHDQVIPPGGPQVHFGNTQDAAFPGSSMDEEMNDDNVVDGDIEMEAEDSNPDTDDEVEGGDAGGESSDN